MDQAELIGDLGNKSVRKQKLETPETSPKLGRDGVQICLPRAKKPRK
jgi:hypothetical protein